MVQNVFWSALYTIDTNKPGQVEQRLSTLDWLITLFDPWLSARYIEYLKN